MSENNILEQAIAAFNYSNEAGEKPDESLLELNELLDKVKDGTPEEKIVSWLLNELTTILEEEAGSGKATVYSEARLSENPDGTPGLEAFNSEKDVWEKINL